MKTKISLYGRIAIPKSKCSSCETDAFVLDGNFACCGRKCADTSASQIKRESSSCRVSLSKNLKEHVLRLQEFRCYLCGCSLKDPLWYSKNGRWKRVRVEFDHFIPRSFVATNHLQNIYAMCDIDNRIKSSKMFDTQMEARNYVMDKRRRNGTLDLFTDFERLAFQGYPSTQNDGTSRKWQFPLEIRAL